MREDQSTDAAPDPATPPETSTTPPNGLSTALIFLLISIGPLGLLLGRGNLSPQTENWVGIGLMLTPWVFLAICLATRLLFSSSLMPVSGILFFVTVSCAFSLLAMIGVYPGRGTLVSGYLDVFGMLANQWSFGGVIIVIVSVEFLIRRKVSSFSVTIPAIAFSCIGHFLFSVVSIDEYFDTIEPRHLISVVTAKSGDPYHRGRYASPLVVVFGRVNGMAPQTGFYYGVQQFIQIQVGQPICVDLHPGALGIPWFSQGKDCH